MDVEMPGITGTEAVRRIRRLPAALAGTPIIAGSGNPDSHLKRDILAAGADAFLPKPMDVSVLLETIAMLLQRHWQRRVTDPVSESRPAVDRHGVGNTAA
jgi:CheY-like chemotaxis protein